MERSSPRENSDCLAFLALQRRTIYKKRTFPSYVCVFLASSIIKKKCVQNKPERHQLQQHRASIDKNTSAMMTHATPSTPIAFNPRLSALYSTHFAACHRCFASFEKINPNCHGKCQMLPNLRIELLNGTSRQWLQHCFSK